MKKKILAVCVIAALLLASIGGATIAYFTDSAQTDNVFTSGSVKVQLLRSKYHRQGNDGSGTVNEYPTEGGTMEYVTGNFWSDEKIGADAQRYKDYLHSNAHNLVPSNKFAMCPYVVNTGKNPAYIRIRLLIEARLDDAVIDSQFCTAAIKSGEFVGDSQRENWPVVTRKIRNGKTYNVYTFTRVKPLEPGQMTTWNVWNYVGIANSVTSEQIVSLNLNLNSEMNVRVEVDAIQASGFDGYWAAWEAFDNPNNNG